jgi:hypothetical protein
MPLQKVQLRPGVNRETTNYANEGGYFVSEKVRFRGGFAQKIGGWVNITSIAGSTFKGVARSLWNWVTLQSQNLLGVGTNQKYYVELGGEYYDITPLRAASISLSDNPFTTTSGSKGIFVAATSHGTSIGSYVTFSGATAITGGGMSLVLNGEFEVVEVPSANTFTIISPEIATSTVTGGGSLVIADYQINAGNAVYTTQVGWGGPPWGFGTWGSNQPEGVPLRLWSQFNFGDDLIFAERGGEFYYWTKDTSTWARAISLEDKANSIVKFISPATFASGTLVISVADATGINTGAVVTGAGIPAGTYVDEDWNGGTSVLLSAATTASGTLTDVSFSYAGRHIPNKTNLTISSPVNDFTFAMGSNPYSPINFTTDFDPLLVRWSDQDNPWEWVPEVTNQSGEQRLSSGSEIVAAVGTRQEILVLTDTAIYSAQYLGPPFVWGFNVLDEDISVASQNAIISINNAVYWMGTDKFFVYDGRVNTLPCTLRQHVFSTINREQLAQVVCGNNEAFSEIWWFYPGTGNTTNSLYVMYNYLDNVWAYGSMPRTAFARQTIREFPQLSYSIQESYIDTDINATQNTISLINASSYPRSGVVIIGTEEIIYTGVTNNVLTGCIRGANGTVAASHVAFSSVSLPAPNQVLFHEVGWDDTSTGAAEPIEAFIESSDFDIGDGDHFAFVSRIIPDVKFLGSSTSTPAVDLTITPHNYPGSAYGTGDTEAVVATVVLPIERYTEQVFTRIRGRQLAFRVASTALGVAWQVGAMRLDIRQDGRR